MDVSSEDTPLICSYTQNALNSMGATKEEIEKLRDSRDEKQTQIEKIQNHLDFLCNANMEKEVYLHSQECTLQLPNKGIVDLREDAQKVYNSCLENSTKVNEIDTLLPSVKHNLEVNMKSCEEENKILIQKVANLSILLERLTADRQKRQDDKELRESLLREENEKIKAELKAIEEEDELTEIDETEASMLEAQNTEMHQKIVTYKEINEKIEQHIAQLDDDEMVLKRLHEEKMEILKKRFTDSEEEMMNLQKQYDEHMKQELQYSETVRSLEQHNAELRTDVEKTAQFWEDLLTHSDSAFKQIEKEIDEIKRDIEERNVTCSMMEEQKTITCEELAKIEEFLTENPLDGLKSNLKTAETKLNELITTLETSTASNQSLTAQNRDVANEIILLEEPLNGDRLKHADLLKKDDERKSKQNLLLCELRNKYVIEERCLEKEIDELATNKTKIEKQIQEMEVNITDTKQKVNNLIGDKDKLASEIAENKTKYDQSGKEFKEMYLQKVELNKKNFALLDKKQPPKKLEISFKLPTIKEVENPNKIVMKKTEKTLSDKFTRPTTPEPKKMKKHLSSKGENKTNWDSDSSQDEPPKKYWKNHRKKQQMKKMKF